MATFNSCQFIGRLGKDPDFTVTSVGKPVAKFSLAVDQGKDHQGNKVAPLWLNVVAWERLAEIVEKYAVKGAQVFVSGRLQVRLYDDKNGVKRQSIDLVAGTIQLLDKREAQSNPRPSPTNTDAFEPFLDEDDIP